MILQIKNNEIASVGGSNGFTCQCYNSNNINFSSSSHFAHSDNPMNIVGEALTTCYKECCKDLKSSFFSYSYYRSMEEKLFVDSEQFSRVILN